MNHNEFKKQYLSDFQGRPIRNPFMEIDDDEYIHEILSSIETENMYNPESYEHNIAVIYFTLQRVIESHEHNSAVLNIICQKRELVIPFRQVVMDIFRYWNCEGNVYEEGGDIIYQKYYTTTIDVDYRVSLYSSGGNLYNKRKQHTTNRISLDLKQLSACVHYREMWFMNRTTYIGDRSDAFTFDWTI